jgi:rhomboid protease GluP
MRSVEKRRMCPNCRAFITTDDRVCPYCDFKLGQSAAARHRDSGPIAGFIPQAGFTTFVILLINLGLYAATVIVSRNTYGAENAVIDVDGRALVMFGGKYVPYIMAGQWWRLVTAGFLHGGLLHILMNSWVLFSVGAQTEETYGTARYLVLYFVATVGGFLASTYFSNSLSVGASAGLFGLIGAMIAAGVRSKTAMGSAIRAQYTQWVIYMVIIGFLISGIDTAAHLGGLAAGFGIAWIMDQPGAVPRWTDKVWRAAAAVSLGLTALSFALMLRFLFSA